MLDFFELWLSWRGAKGIAGMFTLALCAIAYVLLGVMLGMHLERWRSWQAFMRAAGRH